VGPRCVEDGWVIEGRKIFVRMGPAATVLSVGATYEDHDCVEHYGFALVPVDTPCVVFDANWDALDMCGSDSGSVSFRVRLECDGVHGSYPVGTMSAGRIDRFPGFRRVPRGGVAGIAGSAHDRIIAALGDRADATLPIHTPSRTWARTSST
jgi:alkylation response protein AidB-like acyl-CoA dehydrogenase